MMSRTFESAVDTETIRECWLAYVRLWSLGLSLRLSVLLVPPLALPVWPVSVEQLPRLMSGMLFFGYLLVFAITVLGGWLLPTLGVSIVAMLGTWRLLAAYHA